MLDRKHPPRPPHARLHLVDDEQDSVLPREIAQPLQEHVWRNDVAALALYWLDDQRRHFVRRHEVHEKLLLDEVETLGGAGIRSRVDRTAVTVGVWRVIRPRDHRRKALALDHLACRRRKRAHRTPVKGAQERDDVLTLRGNSRA